ncbi:phosphopantetheine-binding protein [Micromonospora sp. WMMA1949]|uniref:phosphopantetheine-binding protein n=1 Tax=unclassified Micromonospora TaxID=2617518 RepID=UPI0022B687C7|nr:phosphopantetheine-binding protein [Micromonospora sp. WMMA1949]MCZ7428580.1 phosphopantetheine-binding protein [Micromonospora sp. WMMA1949]
MTTEPTAGPGAGTEQTVLRIWSGVLKRDSIAGDDDFFAIGGNSMSATLSTYKLREEFAVELPLMLIFENPTAVELAKAIDELVAQKG